MTSRLYQVNAWLVVCALLSMFSSPGRCPAAEADQPMLKAAIFVQNRASQDFQKHVDALNDLVTTRLTEKGFSIIDKDLVVSSFRESRDVQDPVREAQQQKVDNRNIEKTEATPETVLSSASALRISQMLGADYIVVASISSVGKESRTFKGKDTDYGANSEALIYTMRISLKVIEGKQGGTIYGDVVTATEKVPKTDNFESDSTDIVNKLLDNGALLIADNITAKIGKLRAAKPSDAGAVEFAVNSNVGDASVELDGAAIGSAPGKFTAVPGLHQMRISREWFVTWDKTVNLHSNQVISVNLELSEEGRKRYKDTESFKMAMAKAKQDLELEKTVTETKLGVLKEQSEADAYAQKKIAEGEKKKREQSYVRDDGIGHEIKEIMHGDK